MSGHTQGPWGLDTVPTSVGLCHRIGPFPAKREDDKPKHACVYVDYPSPGGAWEMQMEANARVMAAAPELLAALEMARTLLVDLEGYEVDGPSVSVIDAAIAKATGAQQ